MPQSRLECYEGCLNRLAAFGSTDDNIALESAEELERVAEEVAAVPVIVTEGFVGQCGDILENFTPDSIAVRTVLMLLANLCLADENRILAVSFGIPSTCVVLLQQVDGLPAETIYYAFDLMSTIAANDAQGRQRLRPCIPHVIKAMQKRCTVLDILFGASFLLSTLTLLNVSNCEVIVSSDGMQVLVDAYLHALKTFGELKSKQVNKKRTSVNITTGTPEVGNSSTMSSLQRQRDSDRMNVCEGIKRWSKDTLKKLCRAPIGNVDQKLSKVNFGVYGAIVEMDELKWSLTFERKAFLGSLQS